MNMNPTAATPRGRSFAALAALVFAMLIAIAVPATRPTGLLRDFDAFYCAGHALRAHADPYLAEPLGSCEREPKPPPLISGTPGLAMPAPLPPHALGFFRIFSGLPYVTAAAVWTLAGIASVALTVFAMRRLTGLPVLTLVAAFALTDGFASLALGQIAPIAVAAIALAALFVSEDRDTWAAGAAAVSLIEPHLGVPLCAGLFVFRTRARYELAVMVAAYLGASLAGHGFGALSEYVSKVVPAHALSEVANEKQFSLTYALHRLGIADESALRAGELSYVVMIAAGIVAGGALARRTNAAAVALVPPAFAVFGGPFVHVIQIAAAIPAALFLYRFGSARLRPAFAIAIVALAVPWIQFANLGTIFIALAAIVVALLTNALVDERPLVAAIATCVAVAFLEGAIALTVPNVPDAVPVLRAHYDPRALAEASWALYVRTIGSTNALAFDVAKIPTVAALCALTYATIVEAFGARVSATVAIGGKEAGISRRTTVG